MRYFYLTLLLGLLVLSPVKQVNASACFFDSAACLTNPYYRLKNYVCCCGGTCLVTDSRTHYLIEKKTQEYLRSLGEWQAASDATGLNALAWHLSTGPANEAVNLNLPNLPSPVRGFDPVFAEYKSRCIVPLWMLARDGVVPEPPEKFVDGGGGTMVPNRLYSEWLYRSLAVQITQIIEDPKDYLKGSQRQRLNRNWCRKKYVSDIGYYQSSFGQSTLSLVNAYKLKMAQYVMALNEANMPCRIANPNDFYIGTGISDVKDLIGAFLPKKVGVPGCRRLDQAMINSMAHDRMVINEHRRMMKALQSWQRASLLVEAHGSSIFDQ